MTLRFSAFGTEKGRLKKLTLFTGVIIAAALLASVCVWHYQPDFMRDIFAGNGFNSIISKVKGYFTEEETGAEGSVSSADESENEERSENEPEDLWILKTAYPDIQFASEFDEEKKDWKISVCAGKKEAEFFWCEGRMLPETELGEKDRYWTLLYHYDQQIRDPKDYTEDEIQQIRAFSSPENRSEGPGTPPFFYDLVYDCKTRGRVESHIVKHRFLEKKINCHERICAPLERVEKRILEAAETEHAVQEFVKTLLSADCYSWRKIRDSRSRSFHSVGIAIDLLCRSWGSKKVYWAWERDLDPENWMLLPLERRWMPSETVIKIFEEEGFIWGGKWVIWDNMHFEYHPEIILKNFGKKAESSLTKGEANVHS